jgi:HSP20 family molecular chaperone IbpA
MSTQLVIPVTEAEESAPVKAESGHGPFENVRELYDTIARRAFEAFICRGQKDGYDFDDWIKAESELLHPVHLAITESDGALTVRAEVPGFSATDLKVRVDGHLLTISGKRETSEEHKTNKSIYSERCSNEIYRAVALPSEADPKSIQATLDKGVLEFVMAKVDKK